MDFLIASTRLELFDRVPWEKLPRNDVIIKNSLSRSCNSTLNDTLDCKFASSCKCRPRSWSGRNLHSEFLVKRATHKRTKANTSNSIQHMKVLSEPNDRAAIQEYLRCRPYGQTSDGEDVEVQI